MSCIKFTPHLKEGILFPAFGVLSLSPTWSWGSGLPLLLETRLVDHVSPFLFSPPSVTRLERKEPESVGKLSSHWKFIWSFWQASACPFLSFPPLKGLTVFTYHFVSIISSVFPYCWGYLVPAPSSTHPPFSGWTRAVKIKMVECPDSCSYNPTEVSETTRPRVMLSLSGFLCQNQAAHCVRIGLCRTLYWAIF